jgi:ribulose-5-phosphate 4-epimerase/fuculose-1-phosphate aldolase
MDDGYIKYRSERHDGIVPGSAQLEALNQARTSLFDLGLIGVYPDGVGYGNLSIRAKGDQFVITASATGGIRTLSIEQYCLVEAFSAEHNHVQSLGALPASSEAMTHGAIYSANPAVHCVVHVHCRKLFDYWLANSLLATAADIPYGTPTMAGAVSQLAIEKTQLPVLFAMAGHDEGIVAYGADVATAHALLLTALQRAQIV